MNYIDVIKSMLPGKRIFVCLGMRNEFNPLTETITLTAGVITRFDTEAIATVAHECGHATQNLKTWVLFTHIMRMVVATLILALGVAMYLMKPLAFVQLIVYINIGILILYRLVVLAIEFDASRKAYQWMRQQNFNRKICLKVYRSALLTYINPFA